MYILEPTVFRSLLLESQKFQPMKKPTVTIIAILPFDDVWHVPSVRQEGAKDYRYAYYMCY